MVAATLVTIDSILTIVAKLAPLAQQALAAGQTSVPAADVQAILDQEVKIRDETLAQLDADIAAAKGTTPKPTGPAGS
jgi:hypothetical protein